MDIEADGAALEASSNDDLRSALESAVRESSSRGSNEPADTTAAPRTDATPADKTAADRARDAAGRFAPKAGDAPAEGAKQQGASAPAATETAPAATRKAPVGYDQAEFEALPPGTQEKLLKREADYSKGIQTHAEKAKAFDTFDQVLAPHRADLARRGMEPAQAVSMLLQAQRALDENPVAALFNIAKSYGIDLTGIPIKQVGSTPQQQTMTAEQQRLARIEQWVQQQAQAEQQRTVQSIQTDIASFGADPKNKHFGAVGGRMAALIQSGQAQGLQDAYDQAIWLEPSIREQLLAERAAPAAAHAQAARDQEAVQRAKSASSSVRGAPAGAVSQAPKAKASLREELEAAIEAHRR